jgi:uncharacterized protein with NAD-binding domain and iron-sulfur cluster
VPGDGPKVLVLGGGMAGLSAAWRLSEPGWQRRFGSITVLEASSLLGGKGASTRGVHGRIEEHGLHVWLGHYDNAFRVVRECYEELARTRTDPACPIRTWRQAFAPAHDLGLFDLAPTGWLPWVARFSGNRSLPGERGSESRAPTVAELVVRAALLVRDFYVSLRPSATSSAPISLSTTRRPPTAVAPAGALWPTIAAASQQLLLLAGRGGGRLAGHRGGTAIDAAFAPLLGSLRRAVSADDNARRLHDLMDLVRTVLVGMAVDGLRGERDAYEAIDHLDFREWLTQHGAQRSTLHSAIVRGQYDLVFSHAGGDPARPRFAAGWGAYLSSKLWFEYKGAIFWKMRAGMGDVVFAPLHQALTARGVRIELGQRVDHILPAADRSTIASLVVTERLEPGGAARPRPLTTVGGLPCFAPGGDLVDGPSRKLRMGEDFDAVVLAIPPAAARTPCRRLAEQRPEWRRMFDGLGSVATQAFQLWLRADERALGWTHPGTTMSAFAKPFDTWASMSHLADLEAWPDHDRPSTIAYFCSTCPAPAGDDHAGAADRTRSQAIDFLEREARHFWPRAVDPATNGFRWDLLCGDASIEGRARFDTQYWTANTTPTDLYVQTLPGTSRLRLRPDRSGYANLVLAGDWTDSGINAGCIEAAVVSGLQAANSLLGRPTQDRISGVFLR